MQILLVDDDAVSLTFLDAVARRLGHEVSTAPDGQAAWQLLQLAHFPVVISDWSMPRMDGTELCRHIRERSDARYTYFILITAAAGKERYLEGMQAGADDFIAKPVDAEELGARLGVAERILGLRRHVQQLEGLLPICSYCKRIRSAGERWDPIEVYVSQRSEAQFSHGICPDCDEKHVRPQLDALDRGG